MTVYASLSYTQEKFVILPWTRPLVTVELSIRSKGQFDDRATYCLFMILLTVPLPLHSRFPFEAEPGERIQFVEPALSPSSCTIASCSSLYKLLLACYLFLTPLRY